MQHFNDFYHLTSSQSSFPARNVRSCRVLQVKDAVNLKRKGLRVAQITVWDAEALGKEALVEGKTYMVRKTPCADSAELMLFSRLQIFSHKYLMVGESLEQRVRCFLLQEEIHGGRRSQMKSAE